MSIEKQIEEMAKVIADKTALSIIEATGVAEILTGEDYRKASEVVAKIIDDLEGIYDYWRNDDCIRESSAIILAIAELKKKYTEEGK